jgi:hypothetical protein
VVLTKATTSGPFFFFSLTFFSPAGAAGAEAALPCLPAAFAAFAASSLASFAAFLAGRRLAREVRWRGAEGLTAALGLLAVGLTRSCSGRLGGRHEGADVWAGEKS